MNINETLTKGINALKSENIEDGALIAKELLCYELKKDRQYLIINMYKEIDEFTYNKFINDINKVITGTPPQYITHKQEFMGINFYVDENVLIPQPDTEILVENVLDLCNNLKKAKILDLCTGSGAIAVSLGCKLKNAEIVASDISPDALYIAKKNSEINNTSIKFINSNLFENLNDTDFDIIVSNPPYIKRSEIGNLSKQVQNEPNIALDGGNDGLDFYRLIAKKAKEHLTNGGYLCLEIGYDQKDEVINLLQEYSNIKSVKDLGGNDRCIIAQYFK